MSLLFPFYQGNILSRSIADEIEKENITEVLEEIKKLVDLQSLLNQIYSPSEESSEMQAQDEVSAVGSLTNAILSDSCQLVNDCNNKFEA